MYLDNELWQLLLLLPFFMNMNGKIVYVSGLA